MSWLFKSLQSDDTQASTSALPAASPAGVKEDLSAIGQSIGRQLRGVAAFLAPPPPPPIAADEDSPESESESESEALIGIRNDLAEIGGSFKSGLTLLSSNSNRAVSEISRFATNFLPFQEKSRIEEEEEEGDDDDNEDGIPGITDEVLQFVAEISKRSECWTDFPLRLDHEFSMSDVQREHASTVEQLIPDLAALRLKLCSSMREDVFWMIYFILLVPRLSGNDSELLSTPEIVEARDALLQKLQSNRDAQIETSANSKCTSQDHIQVSKIQGDDNPSSEHDTSKFEVSDKANTEKCLDKVIDDSGNSSAADVKFETEDDISFSDLEDDDSELSQRLSDSRRVQDVRTSPPSESNDWVQLRGSPEAQSGKPKAGKSKEKDSEGEESSDWLTVDDYD